MSRSRSRTPKTQRRIKTSSPGRIAFRPGKKHPLDVQFEEARQAKVELEEQLALFTGDLPALLGLQDLPARMQAEDEAIRSFLIERYGDYFHEEHIQATFLWLRRRRAIARVQAARAALSLAQELLAPDPFIEQLQDLIYKQPAEDVPADQAKLTGNAQGAREQLAHYEGKLQEIRRAVNRGNGWIERFFVNKPGFRPEVLALAYAIWKEDKTGAPVPPELFAAVHPEVAECLRERKPIPQRLKEEATYDKAYGPYYKYRWREGNSPTYTISLGRISDRPEGSLPFRSYLRFSKE